MQRFITPLLLVALLSAAAVSCGGGSGDDSGDGDTPQPEGTPSELGTELDESPAVYAPYVEELPGLFFVNQGETYGLSSNTFASLGPFRTVTDGDALATQWGYDAGFQVVFEPDGQLAGVLQGRYYLTVVIHRFETAKGARDAFAHYKSWSDGVEDSDPTDVPVLGNESAAWTLIQGTVATTDMAAVFHRLVFRSGNILADIRTQGGQPFISIDDAVEIAQITLERMNGTRPADLPTPIAAPTSPAF